MTAVFDWSFMDYVRATDEPGAPSGADFLRFTGFVFLVAGLVWVALRMDELAEACARRERAEPAGADAAA